MRPISLVYRIDLASHRTLSPKAAAGVEDGVKPAHLYVCYIRIHCLAYHSFPVRLCQKVDLSRLHRRPVLRTSPNPAIGMCLLPLFFWVIPYVGIGVSEPEFGGSDIDSDVEFFASRKKSQVTKTGVSDSGGKRKAPNRLVAFFFPFVSLTYTFASIAVMCRMVMRRRDLLLHRRRRRRRMHRFVLLRRRSQSRKSCIAILSIYIILFSCFLPVF